MPRTRTMPDTETETADVTAIRFVGSHDMDDLFMSPAILKITGRRTGRLSDLTITGISRF